MVCGREWRAARRGRGGMGRRCGALSARRGSCCGSGRRDAVCRDMKSSSSLGLSDSQPIHAEWRQVPRPLAV